MQPLRELDEAEMKHEFRRLYRELGPIYCAQMLFEFMKAAEFMCQVMSEEQNEKSQDA
jgi:hypothetical protein